MKSIVYCLLAASAMFAADGNSASASAVSRARIVAPIKITKASDIDFGIIVVKDTNVEATVRMKFVNEPISHLTPNPATTMDYEGCSAYKGNSAHTPGAFVISRDASVRADFGTGEIFGNLFANVDYGYPSEVKLRGGTGGAATMKNVRTDRPAEDFASVDGVISSRFQVVGDLKIPAHCLGAKSGDFCVTVAYK